MNNPSPLKHKQPFSKVISRMNRSPFQQQQPYAHIDQLTHTPDRRKNANRSPFANIQNSSCQTMKPNLFARQHEIVSRIFDEDDHQSPMNKGQHTNKQDRRFINNEVINQTLISRMSDLEIQLRKAGLQESILERELESMQNELLDLKRQNQDQDDEIQQLQDQIKIKGRVGQSKHMDEINKLHSLLKEKNNVILSWTNRYLSLEKKYEMDHKTLKDYHGDKHVDLLPENLDNKQNMIQNLNTKMMEADDVIHQTKKSYDARTIQQEKEMLAMTRQVEGLQMLLSQTREQALVFEKDRNSWIEKYESLVQQKYKNIDENKEKLIELRIMNQMLENKCKELKEEKEKLSNQIVDFQSQFMLQKSYNQSDRQETINEKQLKEKDVKLINLEGKHNTLQRDYNTILLECQQLRSEMLEYQELKQNYEKQQKTILQFEHKVYEQEYQLNHERKERDDQLKQQIQKIDSQRNEFQSHRMRDDDFQLQKQVLEKDISILKTKLNESEFKQRQLENENEKLHQIRQEKQREIDLWTRKAEDIQNDYQIRLEELTKQYDNFSHKGSHSDTQQLEDKVDYFEQQYILARQEVDVWRQRVQLNESNSKKDDRISNMSKYQDEQLDNIKKDYESKFRQVTQSLLGKDDQILDQKQIIDQLQNENFDMKKLNESQTDQILKLQITLQQVVHNYDSQGQPSREFSFQNNGEPQNEEQDQEDIYVQEYVLNDQFQMDRRKQETLQSEEDVYDHNYQSQ